MHRNIFVFCSAILASVVAGCGDDTTGDPSGGNNGGGVAADCGDAVPQSEAGQRWAESFCSTLFSCTCESYSDYATEADCIAAETAAWDSIVASATAAGLTYDGECVGCLIEFYSQDLACSSDLNVFATGCPKTSCSMFYGTAAEGESCTVVSASAGTCADGLWCNPSSQTCQAWACTSGPDTTDEPGLGEVCSPDGVSSTPCSPRDEVVCDVAGTRLCEALPGRDEACIYGRCQDGLVCFLEFPGPVDYCTDPVPAGGTCYAQGACADGLHCVFPGPASDGGTCESSLADGSPCDAHPFCQSGYCRGLFVNGGADAECAPLPALGEECEWICADGLVCDESQFPALCAEAGAAGQPCRDSDEAAPCDAGLLCNGNVCAAPAALGEDCIATNGLCETGSQCNPSTGVCEQGAALICDVE